MNIALIGYGKMGHEIEKIALQRGHNIVSIIDMNNLEEFNSPHSKVLMLQLNFLHLIVPYKIIVNVLRLVLLLLQEQQDG